ncbi:MAG TPA: CPBP family intramembrane glutamic endopeptidase [Terriglobales bacterium]|nr:CPBP family intramembrane glutamic endopeptidase [Terriglobales bacterium]
MSHKSEIIPHRAAKERFWRRSEKANSRGRTLIEIGVVFVLILAAVWTPHGSLNAFFSISAAACVVGFAIAGPWSWREMGLAQPLTGTTRILSIGVLLCGLIWWVGVPFRSIGPAYTIPWNRSWQYAIWALVQEFILQSVFFVRFESTFGGQRAVLLSAWLYALAHIPNPVLMPLSFGGGLIFCELFRRYRNVFPLGVIHAALGLTIAASLPDQWLHHMRVGIGYLTLH